MVFLRERKNRGMPFMVMAVLFLWSGVTPAFSQAPQLGVPTALQQALNLLPAVPVAENNLKFQFGGDVWIATLNGSFFAAGTVEPRTGSEGGILELKQTHTYSTAPAQDGVAGNIMSPRGRVVGWVAAPGENIFLEYTEGPPASLRAISPPATASPAVKSVPQPEYAPSGGNILAMFGAGEQFVLMEDITEAEGTTFGVNVLFIGKSGFTISTGIDVVFKMDKYVNFDPVLGFGYVHKSSWYVGGILNFIPKYYEDSWSDVFMTPTFVAGYDFGNFTLGGQMALAIGITSGIVGLKIALCAGVNVGSMFSRKTDN